MIFGISMVRDEADIIAHTVGNMLEQVDHVIVADNLSTDGTRDILDGLPITVVDDPDPGYRQSAKMTRLAELARSMGADWVVPFDADEWWTTTTGETIAAALKAVTSFRVVAATVLDHVATPALLDGMDPISRMGWRRQAPVPLPKVAVVTDPTLTIDQGNHSATFAGRPYPMASGLVVHHFPYRSVEQFVRKVRNGAAAYAAAPDVRADFGAHWRQWGQILDRDGDAAVAEIFRTWYWRDHPEVPIELGGEWQPALIWDPVRCPTS